MIRINPRPTSLRLLLAATVLAVTAIAAAQQPAATLNWKDADIRQVVEAVSAVTGKNFILDPRVTGRVTLLSPTPLGPDALYEAFLSILQVHGYVAIDTRDLVKIIPDASAHQFPSHIGTEGAAGPDDLATQVVQLQNVGATQLVPILRPLIPQYGHLAAHQASNMLIISDRAANVNRLLRIIQRIDTGADADIEVIPLELARAYREHLEAEFTAVRQGIAEIRRTSRREESLTERRVLECFAIPRDEPQGHAATQKKFGLARLDT